MENNQLYNQANTCVKLVINKNMCPCNDGLQQTAYQTPIKQKEKTQMQANQQEHNSQR